MANLIKASEYGQPVLGAVGKWTFSHQQDEFYIGEYYDTPEEAIAAAKSYCEEQGERYEVIYIAQMKEADVPVPNSDFLAELIDDWVFDMFRLEDVSLFDMKDTDEHKIAEKQFNDDICAAVAKFLTAINGWPKFFKYSAVQKVQL